MKKLLNVLLAAGAALGLMLGSASAQTPPAKPASAAAIGYAKDILASKNVSQIYQGAVPGLVQRTRDVLLQSNLNYQKDLDEVSIVVAKELAGREKEIGEEMARIYSMVLLVTILLKGVMAMILSMEEMVIITSMEKMTMILFTVMVVMII